MAINMVISGALNAVSFSMDSWMFSFTQNAQWILAAPLCLIGVFAFDETLKMLWVCLSVFTMIVSPISFFLLRNVDYYHAVSIRNKRNEDQRSVELKKFERDEVFNF